MKKSVSFYIFALLLIIGFLLLSVFFQPLGFLNAAVTDSDTDGIPDVKDNCLDSQTYVVDRFGCSCAQKKCPSDNNPCTDDCSIINRYASCTFTKNHDKCFAGYCSGGKCITTTCIDSDGGNNYYVKGDTYGISPSTSKSYNGSDVCGSSDNSYASEGLLVEHYCNGKYHTNTVYKCPDGCKNGACVIKKLP